MRWQPGRSSRAVLAAQDRSAGRTAGPALRAKRHCSETVAGRRGAGVCCAIAWTALEVGALSFGGGFVTIPLMQADAVGTTG